MRTLLTMGIVLGVFLCGCSDSGRRVVGTDDVAPPGEPRDIWSITGDGEVTLYWSAPLGEVVQGYSVYISDNDFDYYRIGDVGPQRHHFVIHGDVLPAGVPFDFINGNTYFLGVSAFDSAGNESELTESSTTFDTPRPSGRDLKLYRADGPRANESGYDFSRSPYGYAMSGSSLFTDVYFTVDGSVPVLRTPHPQVVEMQDMGRLDFDDPLVGWFPDDSFFPAAEVPLQVGHVILVRIWEETRLGNANEPYNVAKLLVTDLMSDAVLLDWAYQIDPNNRELKPGVLVPETKPRTREVRQ